MTNCVTTGWRAFFHFTVGLDDIDTPITDQGPVHETIEPVEREFPGLFQIRPSDRWPSVSGCQSIEPLPVIWSVWEPGGQFVAFDAAADDDRYIGLRPLALD